MKIASKLHCQFGYASPEKLKKLIKASNMNDQELLDIIDLVDEKCQVCSKTHSQVWDKFWQLKPL